VSIAEHVKADLERVAAPKETRTIQDLIARMEPELEKALPAAIGGAERFGRIVLTEVRRTPALYECEPESLLAAMMLAAQLGLEPGPLGHVYFVPFKRQVTFVIGYTGIIDLAYRSGLVKDVQAEIVYEADSFSFRKGTTPKLEHSPTLDPDKRGAMVAAYAVARLTTGGAPFVVLSPQDVEARRKRSPAGRDGKGPWATDREAMVRKSAVRALRPFLPVTPLLGRALAADELAVGLGDDAAIIVEGEASP
jgi:recombination protein RecT